MVDGDAGDVAHEDGRLVDERGGHDDDDVRRDGRGEDGLERALEDAAARDLDEGLGTALGQSGAAARRYDDDRANGTAEG